MTDREKIIEEMKLRADSAYYNWDNVPKDPVWRICEGLYDAFYRKVPEGAMVLTKEEYERLASYVSEERAREIFHEETEKLKEKISKETAMKFATNLENYLSDIDNDFQTDDAFPEPLYLMREIDKAIDKTLKDFGVEV